MAREMRTIDPLIIALETGVEFEFVRLFDGVWIPARRVGDRVIATDASGSWTLIDIESQTFERLARLIDDSFEWRFPE